ncbi:hypothetical protein CTRI78_v000763 [Colletotrichum trifolii]|uniref:C3H1-type domain-containing protein n=1 Tax=Colletotrichum trifolii TaxID=5466 RepID=A0A4R8RRE0_COLTR|nr:hypothetical protein CTRI78_v000763 [Colletotrichum trifolii]
MTSPEEQELLAKIGQLAGKINLHKAQQAGVHSIPSSHTSYHRHSTFRTGGHGHRHRVGPYPARGPTGYRNRSLVLGNGGTQTPPSESSTPESTGPTSASTWISKNTPGQRSLINSAVYKENSEATSKAIEATRQQRLVKQNAREKSQLVNHFQRYNGRPNAPGTPTNPAAVGQHEVEIEGIRYRVAHNGSKLIKISGDLHPANATPKVAFVGGVKFHRSKTGNLYRAGVLKAHRGDECEERHVFECPDFSNTGKCKNRSCKLLHRERASVLRKRAEGDEMEDLSSDEEEADSDDVDSDEVEEFVNDAVGDDSDFKVQKDFIAF